MKLSLGTASSIVLFAAAAALSPASFGCAVEEATEESSDDLTQTFTFDVQSFAGSPFAATITTHGTACPKGDTLAAQLAPDGSSLALRFASYAAQTSKGVSVVKTADCSLSIVLRGATKTQVAVASVDYAGSSTLDKSGMLARHTLAYALAGATPTSQNQLDVKGPVNDEYAFHADVPAARRVFSACAASSTLNADMKLSLSNNSQKTGSGVVNPGTVDGLHTVLIGLAWRVCGPVLDGGVGPVGRDAGSGPTGRDAGPGPGLDAGGPPDGRDAGGPPDGRDAGGPPPPPPPPPPR